jgi:hypothetical protein
MVLLGENRVVTGPCQSEFCLAPVAAKFIAPIEIMADGIDVAGRFGEIEPMRYTGWYHDEMQVMGLQTQHY